ncbi:AAA family ATPase [Almyronema epifaneia]|uniref:AAA family ATPase n=1 Tax=Almyronema epifaneia S1 TaxID=2991925 RepID=A0ABW6IIJ1_9CYAN
MSAKVAPFADNWAYLKTELGWLERLLLAAVAKQRQDNREVNQIAQSPADRATSHWWKGIITLTPPAFQDDCRVPPKAIKSHKQSYQQLLAARIQASQSQGIVLALPLLCDRFQLSIPEKNLVLLALAPEINRRYSRLYRYLQADTSRLMGIPTVDLGLRLFCRNDLEWRRLRAQLAKPSAFIHQLLHTLEAEPAPLLDRYLQLSPELVNYLLAEAPQGDELHRLVPAAVVTEAIAQPQIYSAPHWHEVVLPRPLLQSLQGLVQQMQFNLSLSATGAETALGQVVLFAGAAGTGKTYAAKAIAQALQQPLTLVDLTHRSATECQALLSHPALQTAPLVLIRAAQQWLGRQETNDNLISRWLSQRRQVPSLTLLTTHFMQSIRPRWRYQLEGVLEFPLPNQLQRRQLWQQMLPDDIEVADEVDWAKVARLALTGGEIQAIAQAALAYARLAEPSRLQAKHLRQAAALRGKTLRL